MSRRMDASLIVSLVSLAVAAFTLVVVEIRNRRR